MKIAVFHELHYGGAKRALCEYSLRLKRKYHQVDLYYIDSKEDLHINKFFSHVYFYSINDDAKFKKKWIRTVYKDFFQLFILYLLHRKISKIIDFKSYNIVFVHPSRYTQSPFIIRFLKTPVVYYCQEPLRMVYENLKEFKIKNKGIKGWYQKSVKKIRKYIDLFNIKKAKTILTNSYFTQKNIYKFYKLKSRVCYLGVDTYFFKPSNVRKEIDILYVGSRNDVDGYNLFNKCITKLKFPVKTMIIDWTDGLISDKSLRNYYQKSKLVLCLSRNEPFGLVPLEAMACGDPVIAVSQGGYKESVLNNKTGFLVSRNLKEITKKINFLLHDKKKYDQFSKSAIEHSKGTWDWNLKVIDLEKILNKT